MTRYAGSNPPPVFEVVHDLPVVHGAEPVFANIRDELYQGAACYTPFNHFRPTLPRQELWILTEENTLDRSLDTQWGYGLL